MYFNKSQYESSGGIGRGIHYYFKALSSKCCKTKLDPHTWRGYNLKRYRIRRAYNGSA